MKKWFIAPYFPILLKSEVSGIECRGWISFSLVELCTFFIATPRFGFSLTIHIALYCHWSWWLKHALTCLQYPLRPTKYAQIVRTCNNSRISPSTAVQMNEGSRSGVFRSKNRRRLYSTCSHHFAQCNFSKILRFLINNYKSMETCKTKAKD